MNRALCRTLWMSGYLLLSLALPVAAADPPVPAAPAVPAEKPKEAKGFIPLQYGSPLPVQRFLRAGILRFVCPLGYSGVEGDRKVECSEGVLSIQEDEAVVGRFRKDDEKGIPRYVELKALRSPTRQYELYLSGRVEDGGSNPPRNPDLAGIDLKLQGLLDEIQGAPVGVPSDVILPYQLSYIQADRAVALLRTFGYSVIEYKNSGKEEAALKVGLETIFKDYKGGEQPLKRPVVVKVLDSESTSLVKDADDSFSGGGLTEELKGGQRLGNITDGTPQQRLLIVHDGEDRESLDRLLQRLQRYIDVPARQLLIEAVVIELEDSRLLDLGVSFSGSKDNYSFSLSGDGASVFSYARPHPATLLNLTATLRALVDRGKAKVLSRPSVLVLDGRQAKINVGDNIPYTRDLSVSNGVTVSSTDFLKTGIILNLRPRASFDNSEVTFQVETIISSAAQSRQLPDGVLVAPTVQSRQVQTLVRVANDTPFVIGGLIAQTDRNDTTGIPGLSQIPILGSLFRRENNSKDRREVIVVITPHILAAGDSTFTYSIPKDAPAETAAPGRGRSRLSRAPERCEVAGADAAFNPLVLNAGKPQKESIFDSFDAQLFRNVYRLRNSDIFDLAFIQNTAAIQGAVLRARELAKAMTSARFTELPRVDPAVLQREVQKRFQEICDHGGPCLTPEQQQTFLRLFGGGAPGEEVFVYEMMVRILERLDLSRFVAPDKILFFAKGRSRVSELVHEDRIRSCMADGRIVALAFLSDKDEAGFLAELPAKSDPLSLADDGDPGKFLPPSVRAYCLPAGTEYLTALRRLNGRKDGQWRWRTILLDQTSCAYRQRNPMALLQSVLALEKLLDLNDSQTFPRTLKAFHVGRELVFPAGEDLAASRYLIGPRTAELFYETLDYYRAFSKIYEDETEALSVEQDQLRQRFNLSTSSSAAASLGLGGDDGQQVTEPPGPAEPGLQELEGGEP